MKKGTKLTKEELTEHLHAQIRFARTWGDRIADLMTRFFGTVAFLILNAVFFFAWFVLNTPIVDQRIGIPQFDPFPYGLLTMVVSLEAIFLSIIVLISQNRQSKIQDIRQRVEFEIDVRSEEENTKLLQMLKEIQMHMGIKGKRDKELKELTRRTNLEEIQKRIEDEG